MKKNTTMGKVIIAGAGPGDPELLTLKAFRYLQQAEVVITDRLVSGVILEKYTNKDALILHVGKQFNRSASTPQSEINDLIAEYALQGKLVVRLKGGDVSIFSNVLDELQTLVQYNIPYEIIPGITAASGAAAYAGIPLTARGHSTAVRFLTYYKKEAIPDSYWKELSQTDDTLVFYMSSDSIDQLVAKLVAFTSGLGKHIAVIEQATTPLQKVYNTSLYEYHRDWTGRTYASPTLVIIGTVAALHQQYGWMPNSSLEGNYFKPLEKEKYLSARA